MDINKLAFNCDIVNDILRRPSYTMKHDKIGEIYRSSTDKLIITCAKCDDKFSLFRHFTFHIQQHLQDIRSDLLQFDDIPDKNDVQPDDTNQSSTSDNQQPTVEMFVSAPVFIKHRCPHCDKNFESKRMLLKHEVTHSITQRSDECPTFTTATTESMDVDIEPVVQPIDVDDLETRIRNYECFDCHRVMDNLVECRSHINNHLSQKMPITAKLPGFCCSQCNKCFRTDTALQQHLDEHAGIHRAHKCEFCNRSFDKKKQYHNHVKGHEKVTCPICNKTYAKSAYHNHTAVHRRADQLFCQQCNKHFSTTSNYRRHLKYVHELDLDEVGTPIPMYECGKCRRTFATEKKYAAHLASHEQYRECTICNRTYAKAAYYNHMARHTSGKTLLCTMCDRQFGTSSNFKRHMRRIHSIDDTAAMAQADGVKCEVCSEEFKNKILLSRHMIDYHSVAVKQEQEQVTCELCQKKIVKEQFRQHMQRHRNNTVFKCDICNAQFIYQHLLTCHQRKHSNKREYLCEFCPTTFKEAPKLELHRRRHTGDFRLKCPWCSKGFMDKHSMKCHAMNIHQTEWNG